MWNGQKDWADILPLTTKQKIRLALPEKIRSLQRWMAFYSPDGAMPDAERLDRERALLRFYDELIRTKPQEYVKGPIQSSSDCDYQLRGRWDSVIGPVVIWTAPDVPPAKEASSKVVPFNSAQEKRSAWPGSYDEYTRTPEFRRIAALAKKEWGYQCLLNVRHRGYVEMHHRSYAHVPFGEDWRDLIPLCEDCHDKFSARLVPAPAGLFSEGDALPKAA